MFNNKRGSSIFVILMLAVVLFLLGMALATPLKEVVSESMNSDELNCSNPSISNQNKAVCTSLDLFNPVFIGFIFGLGGAVIGGIAVR